MHKPTFLRYFSKTAQDLFKYMPCEMTAMIFIQILNMLTAIAQVMVTAKLFDIAGKVTEGTQSIRELMLWAVLLAVCFAAPVFLQIAQKPIQDIYIFTKHHMFIYNLLARITRLPLICFEEPEFNNEIWRAKMCIYNAGLIIYFTNIINMLPNAFRIIGTIAVLAAFNIWLVPLALFSVLPAFIARWIYNKKLYALQKQQTKQVRTQDYLWGLFTQKESVKEMRTMMFEGYLKDKWTQVRDEVLDDTHGFNMRMYSRMFLCDIAKLSCYAICIALSIYLMQTGNISIGQFGACIAAFIAMQTMAQTLAQQISEMNLRAEFAGDYYSFFDNRPEQDGDTTYTGLKTCIKVKNVSFRYPGSRKPVVDDVSISICKGERIVIVGENGSGKTTLSKLLAGVYSPEGGSIQYDGQSIDTFIKESFYKSISVISQDFVRYYLSMRENIGISMPDRIHDDERLTKTARAADIDGIVQQVGGLETQLGREFDGVELSGGEWQKVAIARGLFKDSELIILDEPTSALDPLIEHEILSRFLDASQGKTAIIISHRVGLCRFADRVLVMKEGRVVEDGKHQDLLRLNGEYARFWNEQAKWYLNA